MLRGWVWAAIGAGVMGGCGSDGSGASSATSAPTAAISRSVRPTVTKADFAKGRDYWDGLDADQRGQAEKLCKALAESASAGPEDQLIDRAIDAEFSARPGSSLQEACTAATKDGGPRMTFFVAVESGSPKKNSRFPNAKHFETTQRIVVIVGIASVSDAALDLYERKDAPSPRYVKIQHRNHPDNHRGFKFPVQLHPGENEFRLTGRRSREAKPNLVRLVITRK